MQLAATKGPSIDASTNAFASIAFARSHSGSGTSSGNSVRSPVMLSGAVNDVTTAIATKSSGDRCPAIASRPVATSAASATMKSSAIRRTRPCRSSRAPAIGLTTIPGARLANVTMPASAGDSNTASEKRMSAMRTVCCARRDRNSDANTRGIEGTANRAR